MESERAGEGELLSDRASAFAFFAGAYFHMADNRVAIARTAICVNMRNVSLPFAGMAFNEFRPYVKTIIWIYRCGHGTASCLGTQRSM